MAHIRQDLAFGLYSAAALEEGDGEHDCRQDDVGILRGHARHDQVHTPVWRYAHPFVRSRPRYTPVQGRDHQIYTPARQIYTPTCQIYTPTRQIYTPVRQIYTPVQEHGR